MHRIATAITVPDIYIDMKQWVVTFGLMGPKVHGFLDGYLVAGRRHEMQDVV